MAKNNHKIALREAVNNGLTLEEMATISEHCKTGSQFLTAVRAQVALNAILPVSKPMPRKVYQ